VTLDIHAAGRQRGTSPLIEGLHRILRKGSPQKPAVRIPGRGAAPSSSVTPSESRDNRHRHPHRRPASWEGARCTPGLGRHIGIVQIKRSRRLARIARASSSTGQRRGAGP
jgi:hypothetical protein